MKNEEYDILVNKIIKEESHVKNFFIAFFSGGFLGIFGQILCEIFINVFSLTLNDAYLYVFVVYVVLGSILTGLGVFDKILSIFKCGFIVPSTGFANSLTSAALDVKKEGFIKGIGASIFKLAGSIVLYGIIFGVIFGLVRGILIWHIILKMFL